MSRRDRILVLLAVLLFIGLGKIGQQIYRWQAYGAERAAIARLEDDLEISAVGVIRTQIAADTLRRTLEAADEELGIAQRGLSQAGVSLIHGSGTRAREMAYRRTIKGYNERVVRRNELLEQWRQILEENHRHVDRYNAVADSIRALAERMGEHYYPVRTPAEIAVARGAVDGEG